MPGEVLFDLGGPKIENFDAIIVSAGGYEILSDIYQVKNPGVGLTRDSLFGLGLEEIIRRERPAVGVKPLEAFREFLLEIFQEFISYFDALTEVFENILAVGFFIRLQAEVEQAW